MEMSLKPCGQGAMLLVHCTRQLESGCEQKQPFFTCSWGYLTYVGKQQTNTNLFVSPLHLQ